MADKVPWANVFKSIRQRLRGSALPSVSEIAENNHDPFRVLIATMISLRTKDEVTSTSAERLFNRAETPEQMMKISEDEIATLIYPAGFYRTKARHILECAGILVNDYGGHVPKSRDELVNLPGVGVKTANLTLNLGFGIEAICVDTHVHRISNRLGWVETKKPEDTEKALVKILPRRYWIEINGLFVAYGKKVCTPISPFCSTCPLIDECPKKNVTKSR